MIIDFIVIVIENDCKFTAYFWIDVFYIYNRSSGLNIKIKQSPAYYKYAGLFIAVNERSRDGVY